MWDVSFFIESTELAKNIANYIEVFFCLCFFIFCFVIVCLLFYIYNYLHTLFLIFITMNFYYYYYYFSSTIFFSFFQVEVQPLMKGKQAISLEKASFMVKNFLRDNGELFPMCMCIIFICFFLYFPPYNPPLLFPNIFLTFPP